MAMRIAPHRARIARRRSPPLSDTRGPVSKGTGPFCFPRGHRAAAGPRPDRSLTTCRKRAAGTGRTAPCKRKSGCAGAQHPPSATSGVPMHHRQPSPRSGPAGCARGRAPCAARKPAGSPALAHGHSRSGDACRVRLVGSRHRTFTLEIAGSNPAHDASTQALSRSRGWA
jgi:hypothetical protein